MQRPSSSLRWKFRVSVHLQSLVTPQFSNKLANNSSDGYLGPRTHQFVVLVSPYEFVRDLRRIVLETFSKLYPHDRLPEFTYLKDSSGYDLSDDFVVGEVLEPNDTILVTGNQAASGLVTPDSNALTPYPTMFKEEGPVDIICPKPKMLKIDPEDLLPRQESCLEDNDSEQENESSAEEESSASESEGSETGSDSEMEIVSEEMPATVTAAVETVDDKIQSFVNASVAVDVDASSEEESESETSGSEASSSDEEEATMEMTPTEYVKPCSVDGASESSAEEEETSDSSSEENLPESDEESGSISEEEEVEEKLSPAQLELAKPGIPTLSDISSSESEEEIGDESSEDDKTQIEQEEKSSSEEESSDSS